MIYASTRSYSGQCAHEANPVLVGIRDLMADGVHRPLSVFYRDAAEYLTGGTYAFGTPITQEHTKHARRVLTRLANFTEDAS